MASTSSTTTDSIEQLVTTWMVSGRDEEVATAVAEVSEGRLLGVVKALGTYLTSEQDDLRTKGVDFLATVITRCPENTLNRQSVKVLTAFFCDKLDDTETIVPALKGLASLPPICSASDALVMINAVFAHVKMRALVQSVRFHVFKIIDGLIANHRETLKGMKSEFIASYINLAEGEKDPRNLLVAFAIARVILIDFDPVDHIEALSNIVFCYFPITFRPPPNDPYSITPDDLRVALRRCLNAHPGFGPIAIPIFLEKLAAGSPAIKRDTLQTMTECFPVYGSAFLRTSARQLWNALKLEIFQPTDGATEEAALATVQALVVTIHAEDDAQDEDVQGLARDACEECIGILREPEKSQAKPAIKVLSAFMATTPSVSRYTLAHAVPHLLKLYGDPNEVPSRHPVLLLLSDLIAAARDSVNVKSTPDSPEPPLAPFKDEVLGALISGVATLTTARAALAGLTGLVSTPHLLSDAELGFVVLKVNEVLELCFDEEHSDDRSAILKLLMTISSTSPVHVRDQTLPLLFSSLPARSPPREAVSARARYQHVLSALSTLSGPPPLFEALVAALTPRLTTLAFDVDSEGESELPAAYLHALLAAVKRTLAGKVDEGHADVAGYADTLVPGLYGLCVRAALRGGPAREPRVIGVAGDTIGLVVQSLTPARQQAFAAVLFPAFLAGNIAALCAAEHVSAEDKFLPFSAEATTAERNLLVLFEAGVIPLHPSVTIDADINACIEAILVQGLAHADTPRQAEAVFHIVGSIVNKHVDELGSFLEHKNTAYWSAQILDPTASPDRRRQAIRVWTWMCKGLLVRNHSLALSLIHRLFDVFADETISADAAKAFGDIAASDSVLTKRNGAVVKFLWAQKFASGILPRLMNGARDDSNLALQHTNLIALTALIKAIPNAAYAHEMTQLLPLLLRALALSVSDLTLRANALDTLLSTTTSTSTSTTSQNQVKDKGESTNDNPVLAEHAPALVRQLLAYTTARGAEATSTVRLPCLSSLSPLPSLHSPRFHVLVFTYVLTTHTLATANPHSLSPPPARPALRRAIRRPAPVQGGRAARARGGTGRPKAGREEGGGGCAGGLVQVRWVRWSRRWR
ncbi:Dos2-interacting transcription regulator of RNA-Pol-II-domain-containing protein [Mycena galopus ATCC 62051]|nr:Dos2-interacting transcription regulator of RNA-Pol-II-domain-containing protein [Mycena galopus ATCC 62051]